MEETGGGRKEREGSMTITFSTVCLVLAIVCFVLAAVGVQSRVNFEGLGLALLATAMLVR